MLHNVKISLQHGQKNLKLIFKKSSATPQAKKEVLNSVAGVAVKDLRPFSIVSNEAMKHLAQNLIDVVARYGEVY